MNSPDHLQHDGLARAFRRAATGRFLTVPVRFEMLGFAIDVVN
jgi:hypothetical protein